MARKIVSRQLGVGGVIAIVASIMAMSGGAYAAGRYLITSTKQISPKVLKALRGDTGASGTHGLEGKPGPEGPEGKAGAEGKTGANGQSVTSVEFTGSQGACEEGGTEFTASNGRTFACDGTRGPKGKEGSPWTAGGVLPAEKTEAGTWSFGQEEHFTHVAVAISFTIPLATAPAAHFINAAGKEVLLSEEGEPEEVESTECKGTASAPAARPGNLCVYTLLLTGAEAFSGAEMGASTVGSLMGMNHTGPEARGWGTWAVTAG
jgi:hypothetical protein